MSFIGCKAYWNSKICTASMSTQSHCLGKACCDYTIEDYEEFKEFYPHLFMEEGI